MTALPTTMQTLVCTGPRALAWHTVEAPRLASPGEAIVRPLVVATCDIDGPMIAGETPYRGPIALGHECIAEVVEIGDAVTTVRPGDRVVVPFQISCGACAACRRGRTGSCAAVPLMTTYGFGAAGGSQGGALADALRVPFADAMLVALPAGLDPTHLGSLADNLADAYRAVAGPLAAEPGADVLIVGGGCASIGLYAVDVARALGARVAYVDPDAERCARATALGADATTSAYPARPRARFPVVVDASADPEGLGFALRSTAPDGTCTSVGGYFTATTAVPLRDLYISIGTLITGRCHARPAIDPLLQLLAAGRLHPELVTTRVASFADAAALLATAPRGKLVFVR